MDNAVDSIFLMKHLQYQRQSVRGEDISQFTKFHNAELPAIKNVTPKERYIWDVKALPFNLAPVSKPSAVLERLEESRKKRHEDLISSMNQELEEVDMENEKKIRTISNELMIQIAKGDVIIAAENEKLHNEQEASLVHETFQKCWESVKEIVSFGQQTINSFSEQLLETEKHRSEKVKGIMKKYLHDMKKLSYKLPFEIQEYFEYEIQKYNQVVLSNMRCYEDIRLHLCLLRDKQKMTIWKKLEVLKLNWKNKEKTAARMELEFESKEVMASSEAQFLKTEKAQSMRKSLHAKENVFSNLLSMWGTQVVFSSDNAKDYSAKLEHAVNDMDNAAKQIVGMYKEATVQIFTGLNIKLQNYRQQYVEGMKNTISSEKLEIELQDLDATLKIPLESAELKCSMEVLHLENLWEEVMLKLHNSLTDTYNFLTGTGILWDAHFKRLESCSSLVSEGIDQAIVKNQLISEDNEIKLNITFDMLRQAPDEQKLSKSQMEVIALLDHIRTSYEENYISEVDIVGQYAILVDMESKVLIAEIEEFLEKHPKGIVNNYLAKLKHGFKFPYFGGEEKERFESKELPKELKMCEFQVEALNNWRFGLREGIIRFEATCEKDLADSAMLWVDARTTDCENRLKLKLALHQPRYDRTKLEIHDVRLSELKLHQQRLERHKLGVRQSISELKSEIEKLSDDCKNNVEELDTNLMDMWDEAEEATDSYIVITMMQKVNKMCEETCKTIKDNIWAIQEESKNKIEWTQESNINFMRSLKLFSEGGNYHPDEAKLFTIDLKKLDELIDKEKENIMDQIDYQENLMLSHVKKKGENTTEGLKFILDDMTFSEKIKQNISNVQIFIKKEACKMNSDSKVLSVKTDELMSAILEYPGGLGELWGPILSALIRHHNYLLQPAILENVRATNNEVQNVDKPITKMYPALTFLGFDEEETGANPLKQQHKSVTNAPFVGGNKRCIDYRQSLFKSASPSIEGNSFMEIVCKRLWEGLGELQELACVFYTTYGGKEIIRPDLIPMNYDSLIAKVMDKFKYYHMQCEDVWLDQAHGFLTVVHRLRQAAISYVELRVVKFHADRLRDMVNDHASFIAHYKAHNKRNSQECDKLADKLKPLYGYPGNRLLLEELEKEVMEASRTIQDKIKDFILNYKGSLDKRWSIYHKEMDALGRPLQKLLDRLFDMENDTLTEDLAMQVQHILEGIQQSEANAPGTTLNKPQPKNRTSLLPRGKNLRGLIPSQHRLSIEHDEFYITNLRKIINILRKESASLLTLETRRKSRPSNFSGLQIQPPAVELFDVSAAFEIEEQEFDNQYVDYKQQCDKFIQSLKSTADNWVKLWNFNVENVKSLYSVQYK